MALHVNVMAHSVYRPSGHLPHEEEIKALETHLSPTMRFLHCLLSVGLLQDEGTGELVAVHPAVRHHLYVELPDVRPPTTLMPADGLRHAYLPLFAPAACRMSLSQVTHVTPDTFPFRVDAAARLVAWYAAAWLDRVLDAAPTLPDAVAENGMSDAAAQAALARLLERVAREVPDVVVTNGLKRKLVLLLHEKCKFLSNYVTVKRRTAAGMRLERNAYTAGFADMVSRLASDSMTVYFREAVAIVCAQLRGSWAESGVGFVITKAGSADMDFEDMAQDVLWAGDQRRVATQFGVLSDAVLRMSTTNPDCYSHLRAALASAFNITHTTSVLSLLQQQSYVMTPDFACKLVVLRAMQQARIPVILEGSTGTGKTEQLQIMSLLLNLNADLIPDMTTVVHGMLQALVDAGALSPRQQSHAVLFAPDGSLLRPAQA
ncbi:hypothetical protein EON66_10315, partial [archaeon]